MNIQTNVYRGDNYGGLRSGVLAYMKLSVEGELNECSNKEMVVVLDLSSSMRPVLSQLQSALRVLKRSLDPHIILKIIGYNSTAFEIYSGTAGSCPDFQELQTSGYTNMGAGIQLAFTEIDLHKATWLVVLSDGLSNLGKYRTLEHFSKLMEATPKRTEIISIGLGNAFDANIIQSLGDFVYLDDGERIAMFFEDLAQKINRVKIFSIQVQTNFRSRVVIGRSHLGSLDSPLSFAVVVPKLPREAKFHVSFRFMNDLDTRLIKEITLKSSEPLLEPPESVKKEYYEFAALRRFNLLYKNLTSIYLFSTMETIRKQIAKWNDPCAQDAKVALEKFLLRLGPGCDFHMLAYQLAHASSNYRPMN